MPSARNRQHQQQRMAPIACEDCGKQFKSHYILILHARYHRKEGNYIFQRHSASTQPDDLPHQHQELRDPADSPPPPQQVLGQMSPPHLPNPVVLAPDLQQQQQQGGIVDEAVEDEVEVQEEMGEEGEEEYSADEARLLPRMRGPRVGLAATDLDEEAEEDEGDEEMAEEESGEELECEICDARFHQVLELLKHIRAHRYELTESNYQRYRKKIVTTHRPNDVHVDLRRLAEEAAAPPSRGGIRAVGGGGGGGADSVSGATEFECDFCGKRFPTASNLRRHVLVHTGERPHQCPFCGVRFGDRSYMLKHTRFVHNVELARVQKAKTRPRYASSARYKCQVCNRFFENGDLLAVHLEKFHSRPDQGATRRQQQERGGRGSATAGAGEEEAQEDEEEYAEEEEGGLGAEEILVEGGGVGRHRGREPETQTLYSCDQCDFISADVALVHAHLAEHEEPPQTSSGGRPQHLAQAAAGDLGGDAKPRLTVTISEG